MTKRPKRSILNKEYCQNDAVEVPKSKPRRRFGAPKKSEKGAAQKGGHEAESACLAWRVLQKTKTRVREIIGKSCENDRRK